MSQMKSRAGKSRDLEKPPRSRQEITRTRVSRQKGKEEVVVVVVPQQELSLHLKTSKASVSISQSYPRRS